MSQQSVERYRRDVDAWNRGALDEWLEVAQRWAHVFEALKAVGT